MYDNPCCFLAEHFSTDFASWLLGEAVTLTEIQPSELSLDPIRADAMILLQSDAAILHLEFQTSPKDTIPFRMLDYWVRGKRRYKNKTMRQVVIYLKRTTSNLVYETAYAIERTRHEFDVIRLWDQPASLFLQYPGLLPFAALGQTGNPAETLRQATQIVDQIADPTTQAILDGSFSHSGWAKIRARGNLQLSAERHHARICDLSFNSGRNRSEGKTLDRA